MESSQNAYGDVFAPPPKGMPLKRLRMQQRPPTTPTTPTTPLSRSQHFLEPESEKQDPGLPAAFQRSPKEDGDVGGAADTEADSKADAAASADAAAAADAAASADAAAEPPRLSFPERYAAVVKQVHEDLDATFQEQYDNLCRLQQEEDAVTERMQKLRAEAHAANSGIEQQVSRIVGRMKTALDRIQQSMV
ncbi:uncharacterized protein LOC119593871 [Penaeus monodon]|uniref:uncharacterized protein LOC119593871 n=1 Tax=Penaeus monodon TaxID=6687 RepID=UPI0018A7094D|nr:uncharacterized protein LOC119593871 [Penaeus monodon]